MAPKQKTTKVHFIENAKVGEGYLNGIDNSYQVEKELLLALAKHYSAKELEQLHNSLNSFKRHDHLESLEFYELDKVIKPSDIATKNFRKMADITAAKWFFSLMYLFNKHPHKDLPIHNPDGRVKIAIPGAWLGLEIGGILDFFNFHNVAIDVDAVDLKIAGEEISHYNLEHRLARNDSRVNFISHTDANDYYPGKKYDVVIIRNPGDISDLESYKQWKNIFHTMAETEPELIILTTYEYDLTDSEILKEISVSEDFIKESYLFHHILSHLGFSKTASLPHDWLVYPISPYMIKPKYIDGKFTFTWPVDRYMALYKNTE